jgi:hypothetical protein
MQDRQFNKKKWSNFATLSHFHYQYISRDVLNFGQIRELYSNTNKGLGELRAQWSLELGDFCMELKQRFHFPKFIL